MIYLFKTIIIQFYLLSTKAEQRGQVKNTKTVFLFLTKNPTNEYLKKKSTFAKLQSTDCTIMNRPRNKVIGLKCVCRDTFT